jgi:osmoprotectant transport system permease protein
MTRTQRNLIAIVVASIVVICVARFAAASDDAATNRQPPRVVVGSKVFTESVVLGEIIALVARDAGADASHREQLGGTRIVWDALLAGDIDVYAEYIGTLREELVRAPRESSQAELERRLAKQGIVMSASLGFSDTYALGMKEELAARLGIEKISDLAQHPELKFGFSNEFMDRADGWPGLRRHYGLQAADVRGLDHDLAYRGLATDAIQVTDTYSTDAKIVQYGLRVLDDDEHYFSDYDAVLLSRADLAERAPRVVAALATLEGAISQAEMIGLNARVEIDQVSEQRVAAEFLARKSGIARDVAEPGLARRVARRTYEHLFLVAVSLSLAIALALPLGIVGAKYPLFGQAVLMVVGAVQTIPSLALLVFMIPLFGLETKPAIVALFLYSLLPIVRNTYVGLRGIAPAVRESAEALGLPPLARLRLVELPLTSPAILAGIKTAAVINVGTATLGALIGAGGYGQPILTGIRLASRSLILEGAVPAALLALATQGVFELAERWLVPRGLRLTRRDGGG